ncbi:MAG TPA: hypothetical protein VLX56_04360 [Nitrososphaerales archaeon]|nr:hypothetical protein [Nitrososphaerales archaeon]
MKTIRTISAIALAAFLVLGPALASGATRSMTIATNNPSYAGQQTISVTGTISPAPTIANTAVVVTTKGPAGAVDIGEAAVAVGTGTFNYVFVSGGSAMWTTGTYTVNGTWGGQGDTASAITTFTYQATGTGGGGVVTITTTVTSTTALGTTTVTTTVPSSDAAALSTIQTSLAGIQTTLGTLSTGFSGINSGIQSLTTTVNGMSSTLTSIQGAVNTINTGVTGLGSQLTTISSGLTTLGNVSNEITSMNNAVNNNQTYVLVVAALAAITLVLELAILVRKLS